MISSASCATILENTQGLDADISLLVADSATEKILESVEHQILLKKLDAK